MRTLKRAGLLLCAFVVLGSCQRSPAGPVRVVPQIGPAEPRRVAFSPRDESRLLVLEKSGLAGIWDVSNRVRPALHASIATGGFDACFTADGSAVLTVGRDGRVRSWSDTGDLQWISPGDPTSPARAVAAGPELVVSGDDGGLIRLWKLDGSPAGDPLEAHDGAIVSLAVSPRGDLVSASADETVRLWKRVGTPAEQSGLRYESSLLYREPQPKIGPERYLHLVKHDAQWGWDHSVVIAPDGGVIAASAFDSAIRLWNADGSPRATMASAHEHGQARALAFSPAGDLLASVGFDGTVRLWNLDGSLRGKPFLAHGKGASSLSFSKQGDLIATAGLDDRVSLWNLDGQQVGTLPAAPADPVVTVALAPETPLVGVSERHGTVRLWDLTGNPHSGPLVDQKKGGYALAMSPRGDILAAGGEDGVVRSWNRYGTASGKPFATESGAVFALGFSPDGKSLGVGSRKLQVWERGQLEWEEPLPGGDMTSAVAYSPNGKLVVAGTRWGRLLVRNADGSPHARPIKLEKEYIRAVAVSPRGDFFASAGGKETIIRLWSFDGSQHGEPLQGHLAPVRTLASSVDRDLLASGGDDGKVLLWHFPGRKADVIDVGVPVAQVGFRHDLLWVRSGPRIFYYDKENQLAATTIVQRNGLVTFTPDGWMTVSNPVRHIVRIYGPGEERLGETEMAARQAPKNVLAALSSP